MHEYEIVYQKWKRYRRKKVLFKIFLLMLLIATGAGGYLFYKNSFHTTKKIVINQNRENIILPSKDFETKLHTYKPKHIITPHKKTVKNSKKNVTSTKQTKPSHKLLIQSQTSTLADLKASYNAAPTSEKALLVAKRYYEKKDYKNAAKWAYKANTLNSSNEESWLLFAKALAQDGKKKKAVTVLRIYYNKSGSPKAKLLMQKIIGGEFQ